MTKSKTFTQESLKDEKKYNIKIKKIIFNVFQIQNVVCGKYVVWSFGICKRPKISPSMYKPLQLI